MSLTYEGVTEKLKAALGDAIEVAVHKCYDGSEVANGAEPRVSDIWVKIPHESFMKAVETLFEIDVVHLHIISGHDNGDSVCLRYHFSVFSYSGRAERIGVSLVVNVPKSNLVMPSLFPLIPGSEYSERETHEMYGVMFDGLPTTALVFLPDEWDESIKPWRDDEAGLKSHPELVRRLS